MDKKEFDKKMGGMDFEGITKRLTEGTEQLTSFFTKMSADATKILIPKSKKDMVLNNLNVSVSITTDGKVFVQFVSQDDAQNYYDNIGAKDDAKFAFEEAIVRLVQELNSYKNASFWNKLKNLFR